MRHVVRLAASILAASAAFAVDAHAQFRMPYRSWSFYGCDYAHADVFGPGPRACSLVVIQGFRDVPNQPHLLTSATVFTSFYQTFNWADCGGSGCGPIWIEPRTSLSQIDDAFHGGACAEVTCPAGRNIFSTGNFFAGLDWAPTYVSLATRYYDATQPPGQRVFVAGGVLHAPPGYSSSFILQLIPEPATLTLLGTGLLALGAIARRRRSAPRALPSRG